MISMKRLFEVSAHPELGVAEEFAGDLYEIWRDEMLDGNWARPNEWPYVGPKMKKTWVNIAKRALVIAAKRNY